MQPSQLVTSLSVQVKTLIININKRSLSLTELQLVTKDAPKSKPYFKKHYIDPVVELGLVSMQFTENQNHPKQKYYLTERGKEVLNALRISEKKGGKEDNRELATEHATNLSQLVTSLSIQVKTLIININKRSLSLTELQLVTKDAPKSKPYFKKHYIDPAIELGIVAMLHPDNPKHPKQKYYLTEKGKDLLKALEA